MSGKRSLCKAIRDAGGITARCCPATNNLPTRMTARSWQSLCKATAGKQTSWADNGYNKKVEQVSNRLNVCRECKGKNLPPGLELISKEEMMATKTSRGVCSTCHQRGLVSKAFSSFDPVCSTCAPALTAVNTRPEVVAQAIVGLGMVDKMMELLLPHIDGQQLILLLGENLPETVQVQCESEALREISEVMGFGGEKSELLVDAVLEMVTAVSKQRESAEALQRIIAAVGCECEDHADSVACGLDAIKVLTQTLDRYREQFEHATQRERDMRTVLECDDAKEPTFTVAGRRMAVLRRLEEFSRATDEQRIRLADQVSNLTAENARLAALVEDQADALAVALSGDNLPCAELSSYTMTPERDALADFGLRVLAGKVKMEVM